MSRVPVLAYVIALVVPLGGVGCGDGDTIGSPDPARGEAAIPYTERAGRGPERPAVGTERPAVAPEQAERAEDVVEPAAAEPGERPERGGPADPGNGR